MSKLLTENSILRCSKGVAPMPMKVTSQQVNKIGGLLTATEMDIAPIVNIPCFGTCLQGQPVPCSPIPTVWTKTSKIIKVNGFKCLTQDSVLKCSKGGTISVLSVVQTLSDEK